VSHGLPNYWVTLVAKMVCPAGCDYLGCEKVGVQDS
jgi:hypothetical protein